MNISGIISTKWFSMTVAGVILLVLAILPVYATGYTPILFTTIYMYIILSVSWALFSGPTGYMSLATAAFFGVGIYTASLLGDVLPLPVFILAGGMASALVALLVGALTLRLRGIYFAIFTFGLVMLIAQLLLFFELHVTGTRGRFVIVIDYTTIYYAMLIIFGLLMLTVYVLRRSRWGLALQSIGENEEAAAHIGINVTLIKVLFFALSAFFIGMAGATIATRWTYIDPIIAFDPDISFLPVLMAIFGGMTRSYGPIIGAVIFSYLQEILITKFAELYMLIFGIILVISILYLPNGIIGLIQKLWQKLEKRRYVDA
ncbi:MAG: branched-chain amino acid ABC transporter permease [Dehalococcoidales bacterium]|nr:branched-chain amino acid ABC transporter permease [Dehalococcoidales bacterium]